MHPCEGELVAKSIIEDVPQFNAYVFLENKQCIGKIADVMGPVRDHVGSFDLCKMLYK